MKCKISDRQTELHTAALVFTGQYMCLSLCEHSATISSAFPATVLFDAIIRYSRTPRLPPCVSNIASSGQLTAFVLATLPMHWCRVLQPNRCCQYAAGWGSLSGESGGRPFLPVLCISSWLDGSIGVSIVDRTTIVWRAHRGTSAILDGSIGVSIVDRTTIVWRAHLYTSAILDGSIDVSIVDRTTIVWRAHRYTSTIDGSIDVSIVDRTTIVWRAHRGTSAGRLTSAWCLWSTHSTQ
jgi:hypothetical protein